MTMTEIARELGKIYRELGEIRAELYGIERDIKAREVELTGGLNYKALGANETERKMALDAMLAGDIGLTTLQNQRDMLKEREITLQAKVDELSALRRAAEWEIRARLADMRVAVGIQTNHRGDPDGDVIFDDVADHRADREMETAIADLWGPEPPF